MNTFIRPAIRALPIVALAVAGLAARAGSQSIPLSEQSPSNGAVFTMTNVATENRVVASKRALNGRLSQIGSYLTGGHGKGDHFDTSNGLLLGDSSGHQFLYACNAGSNDITVFAVDGAKLTSIQKISAGGVLPQSLTRQGNVLYVVDGTVAANSIIGFIVGTDGKLTPVSDSTRSLPPPIGGRNFLGASGLTV